MRKLLIAALILGGCGLSANQVTDHVLSDLNCFGALAADAAAVSAMGPAGVQSVKDAQVLLSGVSGLAPSTLAACAQVIKNIQEDKAGSSADKTGAK